MIASIYLQNIRSRNFLYSRELITWQVDVLEKLKNKFRRPYRQGKSETENISRVVFNKILLFAGSNLSMLVTKDINGQKNQREHVQNYIKWFWFISVQFFSDLNYKLIKHVRRREITDMQTAGY